MAKLVSTYDEGDKIALGKFVESMQVQLKKTLKFSSVVSKAVLQKYNDPNFQIGGKLAFRLNQPVVILFFLRWAHSEEQKRPVDQGPLPCFV